MRTLVAVQTVRHARADQFLNPDATDGVRVKVALLFNPRAGQGASLGALRHLLVRAGHELVRVIDRKDDAARLAEPPVELAVAAGGDGTIAAAAKALAGSTVPLAILPVGTANNIGFTLGLSATAERLVSGWESARLQPFDLGVIGCNGSTRRFVEGIGGGLVESCMREIRTQPVPSDDPPRQLVPALRRYADALRRLEPRPWVFFVDGERRTGDFLLVEVLNASAVGPNLELAPGSNTCDGLLTVVTAREEHRSRLAEYIDDRLSGRTSRLELPTESATRVDVSSPRPMHVDGALMDASSTPLTIQVEPGAVTVLVPQPS